VIVEKTEFCPTEPAREALVEPAPPAPTVTVGELEKVIEVKPVK
jgi:hypothetical protein